MKYIQVCKLTKEAKEYLRLHIQALFAEYQAQGESKSEDEIRQEVLEELINDPQFIQELLEQIEEELI